MAIKITRFKVIPTARGIEAPVISIERVLTKKAFPHKRARCRNCNKYLDIVADGLCEGCWTSKQEQISEYGSGSEEVSW